MKVTALIPDDIINEVKQLAKGKNLTESLIVALEEWISLKKVKKLNSEIEHKPFEFSDNFSGHNVRAANRKR